MPNKKPLANYAGVLKELQSGDKIATADLELAKATGAEIITGTDDAKFATAKGIADSHLSNTNLNIIARQKIAELYTKALLHFDGANASTTITDSTGNTIWTARNHAALSTTSPKFGIASCLFDGTDDYVDASDSDVFTLGKDDFTIECWVKRSATGRHIIAGQMDSSAQQLTSAWYLEFDTNNCLRGNVWSGSTAIGVTGTTAVTDTTTWHHVAIVRYNNTLSIYLDGVSQGTPQDLTGATINNSASKISIGRGGEYSNFYFNGYIDEFRFVKGFAVYNGNFVTVTLPFVLQSTLILKPIGLVGETDSTTQVQYTSFADITGLSCSVGANRKYRVQILGGITTNDTASSTAYLQLVSPTGSLISGMGFLRGTTSTTIFMPIADRTTNTLIVAYSNSTYTGIAQVKAEYLIEVGSTIGEIKLQLSISNSTYIATAKKGLTLFIEEVG